MQHQIPPANWHTDTRNKMKGLDEDALRFIIQDCKEVSELQWDFNPKASMYRDEMCYAGMELASRSKK